MFTKSTIAAVAALMASSAKAQTADPNYPGVIATGTMGPNNPATPTLGTSWNSSSMARLVSLNSVDDFCLFGPPEASPQNTIGETEAIEVAWCTKPRNNARQLPLDKIYSAHFVKTPLYVQISGYADLTSINIPDGDYGGELDPHGATGEGNPVGGNVTSNVTGSDVNYEEWMIFCFRICTAANSTYSAALECQHQLDEVGCNFVMPGNYDNGTFTECDADSAYPPGIYPQPDGSTSTFAQRYTGSYTNDGTLAYWTVGQTVTPSGAYSTPASSNCQTFTNINNAVASAGSSSMTGSASGSMMTSMSAASSGAKSAASSGASAAKSAASSGSSAAASSSSAAMAAGRFALDGYAGLLTAGASAFALIAGAGAFLL